MSEADVRLAEIGQIALSVDDLDGAIEFYRDSLKVRFLFQVPNLAFFDCAGVRLMLEVSDNSGSGSVVYFKVDDLKGAFQALQERGVPFDDEPHLIADMGDHELWMAFFRDPAGNLLALMSEIAKG